MRYETPYAILNEGLDGLLYSAAAFAIAKGGNVVESGAIGTTSFDGDAPEISQNTLFDVAPLQSRWSPQPRSSSWSKGAN